MKIVSVTDKMSNLD